MSEVSEHHGEQKGERDDGEDSCRESKARDLVRQRQKILVHANTRLSPELPQENGQADRTGAASLSQASAASSQAEAAAIRQKLLRLPTWVHLSVAPNSVGVHDVLKPLGELVGADESWGCFFCWDRVHERGDRSTALSLSHKKKGKKITIQEFMQQPMAPCQPGQARLCVAHGDVQTTTGGAWQGESRAAEWPQESGSLGG